MGTDTSDASNLLRVDCNSQQPQHGWSATIFCALLLQIVQALLAAGKGRLQRDTESGQLLFDLVKHADVAEWALWINSFGDVLYKALWGDKDTYSMAFAVAGKAHLFNQLQAGAAVHQKKRRSCPFSARLLHLLGGRYSMLCARRPAVARHNTPVAAMAQPTCCNK